jgi:hypothetical protein
MLVGEVEAELVPPAMTASAMPARMSAAATWTAVRPAAQCRLTAMPGTWTIPWVMATYRAMTPPP